MGSTASETVGDVFADILSQSTIIDLTVCLDKSLPCYVPEDQAFILTPRTNYELEGYLSNVIITSDHNGTHCDAPAHFRPGKITLEKMELSAFMGPCDVIDVRHLSQHDKKDESPIIKIDEVKNWEKQYGEIKKGDIVLFYTGWTDMYYKPYPDGYKFSRAHPAPNHDTMQYLADKAVKQVGIDAVGLGLMQNDAEPHLVASDNNIIVTEKLVNLGQLPPRGAFFIFLPIKVIGATGGLGRALAIC